MIKNIIIVSDSASVNGGAANVAIMTALLLTKKNFNIYFFCGKGPVDKRLLDAGVKVICIKQYDILSDPNRLRAATQGLWNFKAYSDFKDLLLSLDLKYTIVHFHVWCKVLSASLFKLIRDYKVKAIITLHDYFSICPNGGFFNYRKCKICSLRPLSIRCLFSNCDSRNYIYKLWRCIRTSIQNHYLLTNKHISYIYISVFSHHVLSKYILNGSKFFLSNPVESITVSKLVDITNNPYYLFIGRLEIDKGVDLFCQAISQLGLKGVVIGDGYLRKKLQKEFPDIIFIGWKQGEEKEKWIQQSKALIVSSLWYETFGLVVVEMKEYGIPSIVPMQSAASDLVINNVDGLKYDSGNLESLKCAILKYEHSDIQKFQNNILKNFDRDKYSWENYGKNLINIYRSL